VAANDRSSSDRFDPVDRARPIATSSQTVGPFFHFAIATDRTLGVMAGPAVPGERVRLQLRVLDGDGAPVPDALVELYQADAGGKYVPAGERREVGGFTGFGRLATDADGICAFDTVRPGPVSTAEGVQAPHINVCLLGRGLLRQVYSRIYFEGDAGHDADPILALVPAERRRTLLASPAPDAADLWTITIRLQGEGETVFFDV
jgi:protocatechuate 3,4-dioxygenase alpha subunit